MEKLYRFHLDCERSVQINSVFIADEKVVKSCIGEDFDFGEIGGYEVCGTLKPHQIEEIKVQNETIKDLKKASGFSISGKNPLKHIECTCSRCKEIIYSGNTGIYIAENGEKVGQCCLTKNEEKAFLKI